MGLQLRPPGDWCRLEDRPLVVTEEIIAMDAKAFRSATGKSSLGHSRWHWDRFREHVEAGSAVDTDWLTYVDLLDLAVMKLAGE